MFRFDASLAWKVNDKYNKLYEKMKTMDDKDGSSKKDLAKEVKEHIETNQALDDAEKQKAFLKGCVQSMERVEGMEGLVW